MSRSPLCASLRQAEYQDALFNRRRRLRNFRLSRFLNLADQVALWQKRLQYLFGRTPTTTRTLKEIQAMLSRCAGRMVEG